MRLGTAFVQTPLPCEEGGQKAARQWRGRRPDWAKERHCATFPQISDVPPGGIRRRPRELALLKRLFEALGLPCLSAPGEAEATCGALVSSHNNSGPGAPMPCRALAGRPS